MRTVMNTNVTTREKVPAPGKSPSRAAPGDTRSAVGTLAQSELSLTRGHLPAVT